MDRFINGLISLEVKQRLRIPPQPGYFREAVERAMSLTAAIYHGDQIMKQRSMAWKMAASASNPLNTKSSMKNPRGSIQMIETPEDTAATVQATRKWCALHKTEKHSNADCRAQKECNTNTTATSKKRPKGTRKRKARPGKLKFKSNSDKKKFLRSIEDTEGVSLESASSDDEDVVEQSLMQLENASGDASEGEKEGDLHILMLDPELLIDDQDVAMDSILLYPSAFTEALESAVSGIHLEGEKVDSPMSTKAEFSPSDTALLNTTMNTPVASVQSFKEEKNPFSPEQYPSPDEDMFPSLAPQEPASNPSGSDVVPVVPLLTQNYILMGGVYYQPVPRPHNVVVAQSLIPTPALSPIPTASTSIPAPAVVPAEIPLPTTDNETNGSDQDGSSADANSGADALPSSAAAIESQPIQESSGVQEFAVPKNLSLSSSNKDRRRSRPRSRSSSSRRSDSLPEASRVSRPQGVTPPDALSNAKRIRGIGRGKNENPGNAPFLALSTPLAGVTAPWENLRITIPAGSNQRIVEVIPDYPTNVAHLVKSEKEASDRWESQLSATINPFMPRIQKMARFS